MLVEFIWIEYLRARMRYQLKYSWKMETNTLNRTHNRVPTELEPWLFQEFHEKKLTNSQTFRREKIENPPKKNFEFFLFLKRISEKLNLFVEFWKKTYTLSKNSLIFTKSKAIPWLFPDFTDQFLIPWLFPDIKEFQGRWEPWQKSCGAQKLNNSKSNLNEQLCYWNFVSHQESFCPGPVLMNWMVFVIPFSRSLLEIKKRGKMFFF